MVNDKSNIEEIIEKINLLLKQEFNNYDYNYKTRIITKKQNDISIIKSYTLEIYESE